MGHKYNEILIYLSVPKISPACFAIHCACRRIREAFTLLPEVIEAEQLHQNESCWEKRVPKNNSSMVRPAPDLKPKAISTLIHSFDALIGSSGEYNGMSPENPEQTRRNRFLMPESLNQVPAKGYLTTCELQTASNRYAGRPVWPEKIR
ncbi:hypothetical protein CEXT_692661 [Caerostris extrusa]|uniref:Uncharacterized protein n=1 Tax=Caerostris extrusa TaxID=172846 RepID=A0AAV4QMT9_CAEEX|nr:hypothetical protein CEXT_692661 [Caerostris extrusa]